jgi:hypothetical protein
MESDVRKPADYDRLQREIYRVICADGGTIEIGVALLALSAVCGSLIAQSVPELRASLLADVRKWVEIAQRSVEQSTGSGADVAMPCQCRKCRIRAAMDGPSADGDGPEAKLIDAGVAAGRFVSDRPVEDREKLQAHLVASFTFAVNMFGAGPKSVAPSRGLH